MPPKRKRKTKQPEFYPVSDDDAPPRRRTMTVPVTSYTRRPNGSLSQKTRYMEITDDEAEADISKLPIVNSRTIDDSPLLPSLSSFLDAEHGAINSADVDAVSGGRPRKKRLSDIPLPKRIEDVGQSSKEGKGVGECCQYSNQETHHKCHCDGEQLLCRHHHHCMQKQRK